MPRPGILLPTFLTAGLPCRDRPLLQPEGPLHCQEPLKSADCRLLIGAAQSRRAAMLNWTHAFRVRKIEATQFPELLRAQPLF